ncbi:MAG: hypothetical protein ACXIUL_08365 [Wenzhouxiangella sp.]
MTTFQTRSYPLLLGLIILALLSLASISMAVSLSEANSVQVEPESTTVEPDAEPARREIRRLNDLSTAESDAPLFAQELLEQIEAEARKRRQQND